MRGHQVYARGGINSGSNPATSAKVDIDNSVRSLKQITDDLLTVSD